MTLKEITARVDECTGVTQPAAARSEAQKRNLATILSVMRIPENMLVRHMQAATYVLRELAPGIGRSRGVFSNRNVRYQGAPDDAALNRDVERFDADPAVLAAITADGQPNGVLPVPVVSIHSLNDPAGRGRGAIRISCARDRRGTGCGVRCVDAMDGFYRQGALRKRKRPFVLIGLG